MIWENENWGKKCCNRTIFPVDPGIPDGPLAPWSPSGPGGPWCKGEHMHIDGAY